MADSIRAAAERLLKYLEANRGHDGMFPLSESQEEFNLRTALAAELPTPTSTLAKLISPKPGYQPGDGKEDGAQLVEGVWWAPESGCDSLDRTLEAIRYRIAPYLREPVAAEGPAVPDEVREAFAELERREQNLRVFRNVRAAMDAELPAQPPAPAPAADGEREAFAQWLDRRGAMADLGVRDSYFRAAALLRESAPAPVPVPVAERPWERPGWCDAEGRCWWFCPEAIMPNGALPYWAFGHLEHPKSWLTHCLPHWAIPQPPQGGEAQ